MWTTTGLKDGEDTIILLPDEASFGADVDVVISRDGDVITIRRATAEKIEASQVAAR